MSEQTKERAFESYVETILRERAGWTPGTLAEWDVERALFPARVFAFLAETQPKLWDQARGLHGAALEDTLINALTKELALKGSLFVLRHGFKFYGKTFRLAYFKPAHGLNWEGLDLYARNELTLTRQVPSRQTRHHRPSVCAQWAAGRDLRAEESGHGPDLAACTEPVHARP